MKHITLLTYIGILALGFAACSGGISEAPAGESIVGEEPVVVSEELEPTPTSELPTPVSSEPPAMPTETASAESIETAPTEETTEAATDSSVSANTQASAEQARSEFDPDAPPLVLAFIPQENPEKLIGDVEVIAEYLEGELGFPVEGFVTQDHAAAVEALRNEEADISFMGALPYVLAHDQIAAEVILAEVYRGSPIYYGRVFVHKDSGIKTLEDLQGKSIAFADPISESGYLYPLDIFVEAGLLERGEDPQNFFGTVYFAGGYQQALQAVANGYVDAAGASQYADLLLTPEQFEMIEWIAESEPIPSHTVIARAGLDPKRVERFKQAMLKLNEPEYQYLLQTVYSPDGYVEATHADYTSVEEIARLYGFIK